MVLESKCVLFLNSKFFKILTEKFPKLSANEKRLCAFLKLNLSTKEISSITGRTTNSIMVARVRLRKKLGITHKGVEFHQFFDELGQ